MIGLGPGGLQDELLNVCNRIWHNKEQALKAAEVGHYPLTFFLLLRVELVFCSYMTVPNKLEIIQYDVTV